MNRLMRTLNRWRGRIRRQHRYAGLVRLDDSLDPGEYLARGNLVLVGSSGRAKWLQFRCPCGCGEVLSLNLMESHSPRWRIQVDTQGQLSVSPSVDVTTCGAHFFIRKNRVAWC